MRNVLHSVFHFVDGFVNDLADHGKNPVAMSVQYSQMQGGFVGWLGYLLPTDWLVNQMLHIFPWVMETSYHHGKVLANRTEFTALNPTQKYIFHKNPPSHKFLEDISVKSNKTSSTTTKCFRNKIFRTLYI